MGQVLGIVCRIIAKHLIKKAGVSRKTARTGAITMIQRFVSALNLNIHFHMLFLTGVYADGATETAARFRWVTAPMSEELTHVMQRIARRVGRFLERQGLLERDAENSYLECRSCTRTYRRYRRPLFNRGEGYRPGRIPQSGKVSPPLN